MRWSLWQRGKSGTADLSWVACCDVEKSWRRIGALNDRYDWAAEALGLTFVDPNSWVKDGDFARDGLHLVRRGKRRLGQLHARVTGLDVGRSAGSKM